MPSTRRLTRLVGGIRRWRSREDQPVEVRPNLPDGDYPTVVAAIDAGISTQGGEVAARRRALTVADIYRALDHEGQLRFFQLLTERFGYDHDKIEAAIAAVVDVSSQQRDGRYRTLAATLRPGYQRLLERLGGTPGGFEFLITMRESVLQYRRSSAELAELDEQLKELLASWFDVSLLQLERLTWESPASTLELLIRYEAVHEITSWADLRRRLGPERRCYAFMHPVMPGDPLIFVEVALTNGMADSVMPFVRDDDPVTDDSRDPSSTDSLRDTAIFYSISNCHRGLAGVSLGDFLIKSVVVAISTELPHIERFATLSPMPGLRSWLIQQLRSDTDDAASGDEFTGRALLRPDEHSAIMAAAGGDARDAFVALVEGPAPEVGDPVLAAARPALMRLAARYIVLERRPRSTLALDPVANFHLSNGARAERINWAANPTATGWERGLGMMINYRYRIQSIERNHDLYVNAGEVVAAPAVTELLDDRA